MTDAQKKKSYEKAYRLIDKIIAARKALREHLALVPELSNDELIRLMGKEKHEEYDKKLDDLIEEQRSGKHKAY